MVYRRRTIIDRYVSHIRETELRHQLQRVWFFKVPEPTPNPNLNLIITMCKFWYMGDAPTKYMITLAAFELIDISALDSDYI